MEDDSTVFVGIDAAAECHAVAVAEAGRKGEVRYFGEVNADAASLRKLVARLECDRLRFAPLREPKA